MAERRVEEDEQGYLLARANGGHRLHILPPTWRETGNGTTSLCGHTPGRKWGPLARGMKPRGKWLFAGRPIGHCTCDDCAAAYEKVLTTRS